MTPPDPIPPRQDPADQPFDWPRAILGLAAMSILFSLYGDCNARFFDPHARVAAESYIQWDQILTKYKPGDGIFLEFKGFDQHTARYSATIYFRAQFLLYPDPVWAADRSAVINTGEQLIALDFHPDQNWLLAHHIRLVITIFPANHKFSAMYTGVGKPLTDDDLTNPTESNPQFPAGVQ